MKSLFAKNDKQHLKKNECCALFSTYSAIWTTPSETGFVKKAGIVHFQDTTSSRFTETNQAPLLFK